MVFSRASTACWAAGTALISGDGPMVSYNRYSYILHLGSINVMDVIQSFICIIHEYVVMIGWLDDLMPNGMIMIYQWLPWDNHKHHGSLWDDHKPSMFFNKTIIHDRIIYIHISYEHSHHHYIHHYIILGMIITSELGLPFGPREFLIFWSSESGGVVIRRWGPEKPLKHWFKPGVWLGLDQSKWWFHLWFGKDTLW